MKNFRIYDNKIYKVELHVKTYDSCISPVRVGYGMADYVDSKKVEDIYVKKTLNPNVVKEVKTGDKLPVIYEEKLQRDSFVHVCQQKVSGALSSPYFVLICTEHYYTPVRNNFTSKVSVEALDAYAAIDYKEFKNSLNYKMVNAIANQDFYLNKKVLPVSSPIREKIYAAKNALEAKKEKRTKERDKKTLKKQILQQMKKDRRS